MSRHLRLSHTTCQCFWRSPAPCCLMWFASELNGKDHLERIHNFTEGHGYSFYDCLRQFGLEWFGRCSFFDQSDTTGQALWMDLALARTTGQELHSNYVLTSSPAFGNLRKFFRTAIRELVHAYIDYPRPQVATRGAFSVCDQMRRDIDDSPQGPSRTSPVDQVEDVPVVESLSPLILSSTTPPLPVVETPVRSLTPNNRSLGFLQTGPGEHAHLHVPQSRGAVSSVSIVHMTLLVVYVQYVILVPLVCLYAISDILCYSSIRIIINRLILHTFDIACTYVVNCWPSCDVKPVLHFSLLPVIPGF